MELWRTFKADIVGGGYVAECVIRACTSWYGTAPVPFSLLRAVRWPAAADNPLMLRRPTEVLDADRIADPDVARLYAGERFDAWALNHDSINFLQRRFCDLRPAGVLEFGCGTSTLLFAHLLNRLYGPGSVGIRLHSIDQDGAHAVMTEARLEKHGIAQGTARHIVPLVDQTFAGRPIRGYELADPLLERIFRDPDVAPTLIFIDGPFGKGPVRGSILPRLLPYIRRPTTVILDDALRDNELQILSSWRELPGVEVAGISIVRNGMAMLRVTPAGERDAS